MHESHLTKEERKAIKKGYAYKRWKTKQRIVLMSFLVWAFGGMPLAHMDNGVKYIYTAGLVVIVVAQMWAFVATCWTCPKCKTKLPSKSVCGGTATVLEPVLVTTCPHCGLDLTKQKEEIKTKPVSFL